MSLRAAEAGVSSLEGHGRVDSGVLAHEHVGVLLGAPLTVKGCLLYTSHHSIAEPCPLLCANKAVVCKKWVEWLDWRAIRADINASITPENL